MSLTSIGVVLGTTLCATFFSTAPAHAAIAQAEWVGSGTSSCEGASCSFSASSTTCTEVTTVNNVEIRVSGCSAELSGSHSRFRSGNTFVCVGIGSGTLTFTDPNGNPYPPIAVTVGVDDGTLFYRGTAVFGLDVINVAGTLTPGCSESATFTGTLNRV